MRQCGRAAAAHIARGHRCPSRRLLHEQLAPPQAVEVCPLCAGSVPQHESATLDRMCRNRLTHFARDFRVDVTTHERDWRYTAIVDVGVDSRGIGVGETPHEAVRTVLKHVRRAPPTLPQPRGPW